MPHEEEPFSAEQVVTALAWLGGGVRVAEVTRSLGIHANTLRDWRKRYGGMAAAALIRYHRLEIENSRLRTVNRRLEREAAAIRKLLSANHFGPAEKPGVVEALREEGLSEVRACAFVGQSRSTLCDQRRRAIRASELR